MANFYEYMFSANKQNSSSDEKFVEDKRDEYHTKKYYTICCRDGDNQLLDLINYIAKNGNGGHSFDIVVDSGDKEREQHFFWDGDGSDRIISVVSSKTGDYKELLGILFETLRRIESFTWIEGNEETVDKQKLINALTDIKDLARPLLEGAEVEDPIKDALREVKFILMNDDSTDEKLDAIKFIAEEALKN